MNCDEADNNSHLLIANFIIQIRSDANLNVTIFSTVLTYTFRRWLYLTFIYITQ